MVKGKNLGKDTTFFMIMQVFCQLFLSLFTNKSLVVSKRFCIFAPETFQLNTYDYVHVQYTGDRCVFHSLLRYFINKNSNGRISNNE